MSKENTIEVKELSDLLRFIELQVKRSWLGNDDGQKMVIDKLQHSAKMGFDIGKNGSTQFEIGD